MAETTILVCDDEEHLREMVTEYLEERDYRVLEAANADELRARLNERVPDLVLLDIRMPREDGLTALRQLRTELDVPVIMVTATADTVDRVVGLELGADDYIGKPVDLRELEARIKAVLRRQNKGESQRPASLKGIVDFGPCRLDLDSARLLDADGAEVTLTAMEFSLLKLFVQNKGRILTRDQILEHAHDRDWEPFDRSVDLRISRLRRKIEANPAHPEVIRTVRGVGYIFG